MPLLPRGPRAVASSQATGGRRAVGSGSARRQALSPLLLHTGEAGLLAPSPPHRRRWGPDLHSALLHAAGGGGPSHPFSSTPAVEGSGSARPPPPRRQPPPNGTRRAPPGGARWSRGSLLLPRARRAATLGRAGHAGPLNPFGPFFFHF